MERDPQKRKENFRDTQAAYRRNNREKISKYFKSWWAKNKDKVSDRRRERALEYQQLFPEKSICQQKVVVALRKREIVRAKFCSKCGELGDIHAHHYNYDHWKNFVWLCTSCHRKEHVSK